MNARSCPTCRSIGPPRMVGEDVDDLAYCLDTWHAPSPDTGGAMVSTASLPEPGIYDPGHRIAAAQARQEAAERECAALRVEVDAARVIVERRGRIIKDMRASGSELLAARRAASAEVERMRVLVGEVLGCFDTVTDAGATGWIDSATYARVQSEAGLS